MGNIAEEFPAGYFLLGKFLVGFGEFTGAHPQVIHGHLVILPETIADLTDHGQRDTGAVVKHLVEGCFVKFEGSQRCLHCHRGHARRVIDEGHLAEKITGAKCLEQTDISVIDVLGDFSFPSRIM